MFNTTVTKEGNKHIVYMRGKLNLANAEEFSKTLQSLTGPENNDVILEMSELSYVSSDGLKVMIDWIQATLTHASGGRRRLAVCNLQQFVRTIFSHTGFDTKFPVYDSLNAAIHG